MYAVDKVDLIESLQTFFNESWQICDIQNGREPSESLVTISVDLPDAMETVQAILNKGLTICGLEYAPTIIIEEKQPHAFRRLC